jgi:hypothetical protein
MKKYHQVPKTHKKSPFPRHPKKIPKTKKLKGDIGEVKAMKTPPAGVVLTAQALCLMFQVKPVKVAAPDGKGE